MTGAVLAVDPGRSKAGYAVVTSGGAIVARGIEPLEALAARIASLVGAGGIETIALGGGTNSRNVRLLLEGFGLPIHLIDEFETSRAARILYFADHPPRGWRRLVPLGLQLPDRAVDDYAAVAIARRYLARGPAGSPPR